MNTALDTPVLVPKILPEHLPDGCLSIVVFGPGEGEAIVVRLPDGGVGVVDGCDGEPAFELIKAFGVTELAFACMTHPHEDHFLGLDRILTHHRGNVRQVWETGAVIARNYTAWQAWMAMRKGRRGSLNDKRLNAGQAQFADALTTIFSEMQNLCWSRPNIYRELRHGVQLIPPRVIAAGALEVWAWGPRSSDVLRANHSLLQWLHHVGGAVQTPPAFNPNVASGALLLQWGASRVLLAGDLCNDSWTACHGDGKKVHVVNVAHHASAEAHDFDLWANMRPDLAIVTPFLRAQAAQPPRPGDIERLAATCRVAITAPPAWCGARESWGPVPHPPFDAPIVGLKSASTIDSCPAPSPLDRYNAVAVSMDAHGNIVRVVLARHARFYG